MGTRPIAAIIVLLGCLGDAVCREEATAPGGAEVAGEGSGKRPPAAVVTKEQEVEIRKLIEQLVMSPVANPKRKPGSTVPPEQSDPFADAVDSGDAEEQRRRVAVCRKAYMQLAAFKELAIPFMLEHLEDQRPSVPFQNHWKGSTVGDACYRNIRDQLEDLPSDYSYVYSRIGRDGKMHVKPYWVNSGELSQEGLREWMKRHGGLSYTEKQIKCLSWLLAEERKIGACDPESYFKNILPLEIRILHRRVELGEDVGIQLERLQKVLKEKNADAVPSELLPEQGKPLKQKAD
jgi:hypothetical protein